MRPPLQRLVNSCKEAEEVFVESDRTASACKGLKKASKLRLGLPMHQLVFGGLW